MDTYCNNCGKNGHQYHQCKMPIISIGMISFRINPNSGSLEYLMIRRKDTLGYIDFMRGKYSVNNKGYILNMFKQMTNREKQMILSHDFTELWSLLWGEEISIQQYRVEEVISKERFQQLKTGIHFKDDFYNLQTIVNESMNYIQWETPEWGFPKGRRNYQEKDYECALREFTEETGIHRKYLKNIDNILPMEELFTGSNYKSYKHKYFLSFISYTDSMNITNYQRSEVSGIEWKTYEDCMSSIRSYNLEKKRIITNIHTCLNKYRLFSL
jgi:hypothetical protein